MCSKSIWQHALASELHRCGLTKSKNEGWLCTSIVYSHLQVLILVKNDMYCLFRMMEYKVLLHQQMKERILVETKLVQRKWHRKERKTSLNQQQMPINQKQVLIRSLSADNMYYDKMSRFSSSNIDIYEVWITLDCNIFINQ